MTTIVEYPTTSDDEESLEDEKTTSGAFRNGDFQGQLFKWTNYLHGWQERYLILRHGFLNYYKNEYDISLGCRGALSVKQALIQSHEFDECRFDIRVGDSVWYLRAHNLEDRERWIQALEDHKQICKSESGYGSETSLRRHPSLGSLASTASASLASTGSFKKDRNLKEKLSELETFRDLLVQQVTTLQTYFDACANAVTKGFEPYQREYENAMDLDFEESHSNDESNKLLSTKLRIDRLALGDHAAMAIDFKGEALTFKATTDGVIHNLAFSIELMQKREEIWRKKYDKELERRKKFQDLYSKTNKQKIPSFGSPDAEEGPHSTLKDEEFFDAIDQSLDRIDRDIDNYQRSSKSKSTVHKSKNQGNLVVQGKHRLSLEIERIVQEHLKYVREDVNGWDLIHQEGEMKVYRREVEENGIVVDPLKCFHTIKGVTGHEICRYFYEFQYRMEWETTLDSTKIIEVLDPDTVIFFQLHKRVWPAAQRDSCFWSHIRCISHSDEDQPTWLVVNYTTPHPLAPIKSPQVRLVANVALICETIISEPPLNPQDIKRENIECKLTYVAFVNPGGWVPSAALRGVAKREYPRFLKRFTSYVVEQTRNKPILF
jgi:collagen type IV alpha-3-binding protein